MKRLISFSLIISLSLLLSPGCSRKKQASDPVELSSDSELVCALTKYLQDLSADYEMPDTSTAIKIEEIKNGKQAVHVGFNKSEYYFVSAYCDSTHNYEAKHYCCLSNYTWVKFDNPNEISEKYNDLSFVVAFQINEASFVTDIVSENSAVPSIEHFQEYIPNFKNGLNTNGALIFNDSFIYLNSSDDNDVFHSVFAYDNSLKAIPCISFNGQYYITIELYTLYPDGRRSDHNLISDFGIYYDALTEIMDTNSYSVTDDKGRTIFYGLIEIDAFCASLLPF